MSVEYELSIEATLKESGAYFGTKESLDWFLAHAQDDARFITVLLKKGATEPVPVPATIRVKRVILTPEVEGQ